MDSSPAELVSIHDLVELECTGRDVEVAEAGALFVLLERDCFGVLKDTLPVFDTAIQGILTDMWEDVAASREEAVDGLQY